MFHLAALGLGRHIVQFIETGESRRWMGSVHSPATVHALLLLVTW